MYPQDWKVIVKAIESNKATPSQKETFAKYNAWASARSWASYTEYLENFQKEASKRERVTDLTTEQQKAYLSRTPDALKLITDEVAESTLKKRLKRTDDILGHYGQATKRMQIGQMDQFVEREDVRADEESKLEQRNTELKDFVDVYVITKEVEGYLGVKKKKEILRSCNQNYYDHIKEEIQKNVVMPVTIIEDANRWVRTTKLVLSYLNPTKHDIVYIRRAIFFKKKQVVHTTKSAEYTARIAEFPMANDRCNDCIVSKFGYKRRLNGKPGNITVAIQNFWPVIKQLWDSAEPDSFQLSFSLWKDSQCTANIPMTNAQFTKALTWTVIDTQCAKWLENKATLSLSISSYKFSRDKAIKGKINRLKWGPNKIFGALRKMNK
jgi:hypothetical protein